MCTPGLMYCTDCYGDHRGDVAADDKDWVEPPPPPPPPPPNFTLLQRSTFKLETTWQYFFYGGVLNYKQLDPIIIAIR